MTFFRASLFILAVGLLVLSAGIHPAAAGSPQPPPRPKLIDPAYYSCTQDQQCIVVRTACGAPITVNARHFREVQIWYDYIRPLYKCADWVPVPDVKTKACVKNRCTIEFTQPKLPEPDNSPAAKDVHYCEKNSDCTVVLSDCCEKNFINTKNAPRIRAEIKDKELLATCFYPDRRHVKNLRCEKHQCTADLEAPLELPDPQHMTKIRCEQ